MRKLFVRLLTDSCVCGDSTHKGLQRLTASTNSGTELNMPSQGSTARSPNNTDSHCSAVNVND